MKELISVIIPFYYGNEYIARALQSIKKVSDVIADSADIEVIIINDSPEIEVMLPDIELNCTVIKNDTNSGIQRSRVNGLKIAKGQYIQFLDQDDELLTDGYGAQLENMKSADISVGNGFYSMKEKKHRIYNSYASMEYLIQLERLLEIRNLIPSPGECLIKKAAIPMVWINNNLSVDGADDWMLWISMFKQGSGFALNPLMVYRHNDANGANCSANLDKMRESALEANSILHQHGTITAIEAEKWGNAIEFKYYQDTKRLKVLDCIRFRREIFDNIRYKLALYIKDHS